MLKYNSKLKQKNKFLFAFCHGTKGNFIGVRTFLTVILVVIVLLVLVDRGISLLTSKKTNVYNDRDSIFMRYEKTSIDSLLCVADAKREIQQAGVDPDEYGNYDVGDYPIINDMSSTESFDSQTVEIVVFGDSFVYGEASLNRNELFWRQTEQLLRKKGYNCRVTAVAMSGATAYEELEWYENYLKYNSPDLVVFGYVYNDALIDGSKYGDPLVISYDEKLPFLKPISMFLPNIYEKLSEYFDAKTMYSAKYGDKWLGSYISVLKGSIREYYQENFAKKLDSITRATGIPSIVMTLPNIPRSITLKELYKPLKEIFAGTSVTYFDLTNDFNRFYSFKHRDNLYVNPNNNHPGSATHFFYAKYLVKKLENVFVDVLGEKQDEILLNNVININDCTPYQIELELISQSREYAEYSFKYPTELSHSFLFYTMDPYLLTYPLEKGYIKLSFETPVDLSEIALSGAEAGKIEIYYTKINKKLGYDDNQLRLVSVAENDTGIIANIHDTKITSLCFHVDKDADITEKMNLKIYS